MKFAFLTIVLAAAQVTAAQRVAIRVPPDETEQYYLVSFDQSRASAQDAERWMKFTEYVQLWLGVQEIRFAGTGVLPHSDAYGVPACRSTAERASRERANGGCTVIGSWINCILTSSAPRLGRYPKAHFKAFLNAKGVRILKWEGIDD